MSLRLCMFRLIISVIFVKTASPEISNELEFQGNLINDRPTVMSVDDLRSGRHVFGATQDFMSEYPSWVNMTLLQVGQKLLRRRYSGYLYSVGLSTFLVGASTDARRVVISGGRATRPEPSFHRYLITILHYSFWANVDLSRKAEDLFGVMNTLHAVHAKIGHEAAAKREIYEHPLIPDTAEDTNPYKLDMEGWRAFETDLYASPLQHVYSNRPVYPPKNGGTDIYFNQFAMAIQQWAFIALPVLAPNRMFFYNVSEEELWGFIHLFALILRTLGTADEYNICLQPNLHSARIYYQEMLEKYFVPTLFHLDYESKVVMELGIKGIAQIFPYTDLHITLYRICRDVLQIKCPTLERIMNPQARVYNVILERLGRSLLPFDLFTQVPNIFVNSILRELTLKTYGFNMFAPHQFTDGMINLDENILATGGVKFKEEMRHNLSYII